MENFVVYFKKFIEVRIQSVNSGFRNVTESNIAEHFRTNFRRLGKLQINILFF